MAGFDENLTGRISRRLSEAKVRLLYRTPFYGSLVMRLRFALARCQTAATDMRRVIFDPEFVDRITDRELDFILMHEVLHCALQHCVRGGGKNRYFFNIACDIVVNSNIMQTLGISDFSIEGEHVIHLTPSGEEGCKYAAEEVYDMLMTRYGALVKGVDGVLAQLENDYGVSIDQHDIWQTIPLDDSLSDEWKQHLAEAVEAAKRASAAGSIPSGPRDFLDELTRESSLDWKEILHDFIKIVNDRHDFTFVPPDRRFSTGEFILPAFAEMPTEKTENLWFLIDSSGSISIEMLTDAFGEVKAAMNQFEHLSGKLSFFDTHVTEPIAFESIEDLREIRPVGGGGTSFHSIFAYMKKHMEEQLPTAVIILTDGYAAYPPEEHALGVPVLWLISDNDKEAPWGTSIMMRVS